jgi:hypothetical protein
MRRRQFITLAGAATVASSFSAHAQPQTVQVRRIGVLLPFDNENDGPVRQLWPAFKQRPGNLAGPKIVTSSSTCGLRFSEF